MKNFDVVMNAVGKVLALHNPFSAIEKCIRVISTQNDTLLDRNGSQVANREFP